MGGYKMKSMKILPITVFLFIMMGTLASSITNYYSAKNRINNDVNQALQHAIAQLSSDVITPDTIRCYRNNITISELKDTASIAMRMERKGNKYETQMIAEANCDFFTILRLSDQRTSGALLVIGVLWFIGSLWYIHRYHPELFTQGLTYGSLVYANGKFMTMDGQSIRLTPMQHSLLEMFMTAEDHTLTKQDICDRLWPKKPDASDTLYTLIRRIKPIIETNSNLKIESNRGRSYSLNIK